VQQVKGTSLSVEATEGALLLVSGPLLVPAKLDPVLYITLICYSSKPLSNPIHRSSTASHERPCNIMSAARHTRRHFQRRETHSGPVA
jgi:hypothetical protein